MSYRLKRKRFNCEPCAREWNQLVGSDIDSVMCDICSNQSKVVMQDVPTVKHSATMPTHSQPAATTTAQDYSDASTTTPLISQRKPPTFLSQTADQNIMNSSDFKRNGVLRRSSKHVLEDAPAAQQVRDVYGLHTATDLRRDFAAATHGRATEPIEEVKRPEPNTRNSRFQNGAYRMVFSHKNSTPGTTDSNLIRATNHHNRLNLRDTSTEPGNIFGDSNIQQMRRGNNLNGTSGYLSTGNVANLANQAGFGASTASGAAANNTDAAKDDEDDLNDRIEQQDSIGDLTELPALETAHVPMNQRHAVGAAKRVKKNLLHSNTTTIQDRIINSRQRRQQQPETETTLPTQTSDNFQNHAATATQQVLQTQGSLQQPQMQPQQLHQTQQDLRSSTNLNSGFVRLPRPDSRTTVFMNDQSATTSASQQPEMTNQAPAANAPASGAATEPNQNTRQQNQNQQFPRRNIRFYNNAQDNQGPNPSASMEDSPFLQNLFRQANPLGQNRQAQPNAANAGNNNQNPRAHSFASNTAGRHTINLGNISWNLNGNNLNFGQARAAGGQQQNGAPTAEERKARYQRAQSENVNGASSAFADIFSRMAGIFGGQSGTFTASSSNMNSNVNFGDQQTRTQQQTSTNAEGNNSGRPGGLRGRSTTFRSGNGNIVQVVNIDVPSDHPMAESATSAANAQPSTNNDQYNHHYYNTEQSQSSGRRATANNGTNNINIGGFSMPPPQFVYVHNPTTNNANNSSDAQATAGTANTGRDDPSSNNFGDRRRSRNVYQTVTEETRVFNLGGNQNSQNGPQDENARMGEQIENLVNDILRDFMNVFNGRDFMRMQTQYSEFNPNDFMSNFNQNFASDDLFEMIRRMSEQEAQQRQKPKQASKKAVDKLPIVTIEEKHCKKKQGDAQFEPPCCTVCCDNIEQGTKGMFMPCGHIYHPDCLKPWLKQNNTCPVCRFSLPLETSSSTENQTTNDAASASQHQAQQ